MPSGAKKRKAAKKKKESGAHTNPSSNTNNNNLPGIDEVKTQESDGSGVSTPVSQDQDNHQSPFDVSVEDMEKREPSPVESFAAESESMEGATCNEEDTEKVGSESEAVVEVVLELDSQVDAECKAISIEHIQSSGVSLDKDDTSSSSSSSDDESQVDEKKENEEAWNSVVEEPSFDDSVSEQVSQLVEKASADEFSHDKDDARASSNPSDDGTRVDEKKVTEEASNSVVEASNSFTDLASKGASQPREEEEATVEEASNSVLENAPDSDTVKPVVSVSEEAICMKECVSIQSSVPSDLAVTESKENGEKLLPKSNGLTGSSPTEADSETKNVEDKARPLLNKNGEASSDVVNFAPEESKVKVVSSRGPSDETGNGTEHSKNSETPQHPDNEHRLAVVAPRPVQTTSWKGCCGLFEVFIGSSR